MTSLQIRPAGLADAGALAALIGGFRDHLHATGPSDAEIQRQLPRALADPGLEFGCAWLDGEAVGGRALLRHALARAAARGARRLALDTKERNELAQALYRSEGLAPQSHALYPGGREVLWIKELAP
jgi:GNAT superfamily N-acetyltransferase